MCHRETQRPECHCVVGRVKKTAWGFQLRVAVAAVSMGMRAAVSADTLCHPSWRGQGDKELSAGSQHTARDTRQFCWLNDIFLFSLIKRPCVRCSPWASVLDVFFHVICSWVFQRAHFYSLCWTQWQLWVLSLLKLRLLSCMPLSAGPKY